MARKPAAPSQIEAGRTLAEAVLKPAEGRVVYWPGTRVPLDPEGETVPLSSFWQRRIIDQDVVLVLSKEG